jgi:hypothetical protein
MAFLIMLLVLFVVALVPVKIGARVVGAHNTGIGAALLSVQAPTGIGLGLTITSACGT